MDSNCDGIDGDPTRAVFVAPPPLGNAAHPGTRAAPLDTLDGAITAALGTGRDVYVSAGVYAGTVQVRNGVSVHGGYDAANAWTRSATNRATVLGDTASAVGVRATSITAPTVIDRLEIVAPNAPRRGRRARVFPRSGSRSETRRTP